MSRGNLGESVRAARKARELSQEALAREAGVSLNLVNKLERGVITDPHYSTLSGIAGALGVPLVELLQEPVPLAEASRATGHTEAEVEKRRQALLEEIRESYRASQEGLGRYCDSWEQRIADDDLDLQSVRGFLEAADALLPALNDSLVSEVRLIARVIDSDGRYRRDVEGLIDACKRISLLMPVVARYREIGRKLEVVWRERFAEAQPAKATVVDFQAYQEAKLLQMAVDKRAASE